MVRGQEDGKKRIVSIYMGEAVGVFDNLGMEMAVWLGRYSSLAD
jgi:hypothetical protein